MLDFITHLLDVNTTFFTVLDYPMSYLEFFGTIFNLLCVWLVARNNIWNWPIGIVGVVLFGVLFYQIQLYSDLFEQFYYLITGFYGWWAWWYYRQDKKQAKEKVLKISHNSQIHNLIYLGIIIISTFALTAFVSNIHIIFPNIFPVAASYPFLDAFTTVLSFVATILMIYKKIECWYLWIFVDIIGVWLYFAKGVVFISLLYFIFLILASKGLYNWLKIYDKDNKKKIGRAHV